MASNRIALLMANLAGGGAERVALVLAEGFRDRGYEVDLLLLKQEGALVDLVPAGVNLVDLDASNVWSGFLRLVRYLRTARPAALQVNLWPLTVLGVIAGRLTRTRVVTFDHAALSIQLKGSRKRLYALKFAARHVYPLAAERVFVAKSAVDDISDFANVPRSWFKVIYNPLRRFEVPGKDPQIEALWEGCENRVVTAATLKPQKNHALLISAMARLQSPAKLMIIGDGPLRQDLERQAASDGVDVIFTGFVIDPLPYLASGSIFALSSDYEGYPVVLLEAMQLGLTIVSTDCPSGPAEILDDGKYGYLSPCGDPDALAASLEKAIRLPLSGRARERAKALASEDVVGQHLRLLIPSEG